MALTTKKGQENKRVWKEEGGKSWYEQNGRKYNHDQKSIVEHTAKVKPVVQELARLLKEFVNDPQRDFALFWKDGKMPCLLWSQIFFV